MVELEISWTVDQSIKWCKLFGRQLSSFFKTEYKHIHTYPVIQGFPASAGKEPACRGRRRERHGFDRSVGKVPWSRKWLPTPVFLPGNSMGRGAWRATVHGDAKSWTQQSTDTHSHHVTQPFHFWVFNQEEWSIYLYKDF